MRLLHASRLASRLTLAARFRHQSAMSDSPASSDQDRSAALVRAWMREAVLGPDGRLPPERKLGPALGLTRLELRRGLAALEAEGVLTRHVGRGTFLTHAPPAPSTTSRAALALSPRAVAEASLLLEPIVARRAAQNASSLQIEAIQAAAHEAREAKSWGAFDLCDARFHRLQAEAAGNPLVLHWADQIAEAQASIAWGRLRDRADPPSPAHAANRDHDGIATAIGQRDPAAAAQGARRHVLAEGANLFDEWGLPGLGAELR